LEHTSKAEESRHGLSNTHPIDVTWGDCDAAGVVFYPRYYAWFDTCTHALLSSADLDHHTLRHTYGLMGTPLVRASADFRSPATFGDRLRATSVIVRVGQKSFTVEHSLYLETRLVVEGSEVRVWAVADPSNAKKISARTIPTNVRDALMGKKRE